MSNDPTNPRPCAEHLVIGCDAEHHEPTYSEQAAAFDAILDEKLADIRAWEQAGKITTVEAASLRVQYLEHHVQAVRALREEHFGGTA